IEHPLEIHHDGRLVSDYPSVVSRGEERHVAWATFKLASIVHTDPQHSGHVILKVRGFAALGLGDRLNRRGPSPPRIKDSATDSCASDLDEFHSSVGKLPNLVGLSKLLQFRFVHCPPPPDDCMLSR